MAKLLAVVGVDPSRRVRCQAEGCKRPVYAKIHVVETDDGAIQVLGSSCYAQRYTGELPSEAIYTGCGSRQLTEDERLQLENNTSELIASFESERQRDQARAQAVVRPSTSAISPELYPSKQAMTAHHSRTGSPTIPKGAERQVKCHYCGGNMMTRLERTPAVGYKCQSCRDSGVYVTIAARKRSKRSRW